MELIFSKYKFNIQNGLINCIVGSVKLDDIIDIYSSQYDIGFVIHPLINQIFHKNVNDYLAAGDCFVFPSLWEGLPLSLVEAQASGLRCIVSDRITTEANVTGKVQYLSLELPVSEWAEQILSVVEYDRAAECEDNIRLIAENGFSIQKNADRLRKIYLSEGKSFHV